MLAEIKNAIFPLLFSLMTGILGIAEIAVIARDRRDRGKGQRLPYSKISIPSEAARTLG
jgi:hypothetical protein